MKNELTVLRQLRNIDFAFKRIVKKYGLQNSRMAKGAEIAIVGGDLKFSIQPYARYVNEGRKPNQKPPPFRAIFRWVKRNKIKFGGLSYERVAFIITRSIGIKGIKPRPFLDEFYKYLKSKINRSFSKMKFFKSNKKIIL